MFEGGVDVAQVDVFIGADADERHLAPVHAAFLDGTPQMLAAPRRAERPDLVVLDLQNGVLHLLAKEEDALVAEGTAHAARPGNDQNLPSRQVDHRRLELPCAERTAFRHQLFDAEAQRAVPGRQIHRCLIHKLPAFFLCVLAKALIIDIQSLPELQFTLDGFVRKRVLEQPRHHRHPDSALLDDLLGFFQHSVTDEQLFRVAQLRVTRLAVEVQIYVRGLQMAVEFLIIRFECSQGILLVSGLQGFQILIDKQAVNAPPSRFQLEFLHQGEVELAAHDEQTFARLQLERLIQQLGGDGGQVDAVFLLQDVTDDGPAVQQVAVAFQPDGEVKHIGLGCGAVVDFAVAALGCLHDLQQTFLEHLVEIVMDFLLALVKKLRQLLAGCRCLGELLENAKLELAAQLAELRMMLNYLQVTDHIHYPLERVDALESLQIQTGILVKNFLTSS